MKLKSWTLILTLALTTVAHAATNDLSGLLQKGLFEEEANRDLTAAIANYQSLATAFDQDRQLAATAIFRLGECYRKLGKTNEAVIQYERIVKEFGDQQTLLTLSQQNLTGLRPASARLSNPPASLDDLRLALIRAQRLVRSVDGTIEAAHGTNRGPVLISLFHDDKAIQFLTDDQQSLWEQYIQLLKKYAPASPEVKSMKAQIDAKQKAMEARADELAAAAHTTKDALEREYQQKSAESGAAKPDTSALLEAESNAASLQAQVEAIGKMSHDQTRVFVQQNFPNQVLSEAMMNLVNAERDLIKLKLDYTPDHPKYKTAQELVDNLNATINAQVDGVVRGLRDKLAATQAKLNFLRNGQSEMTREELGTSPAPESQITDEEQTQIRNIQAMIQNSPDLINAPSGGPNGNETPLQGAAERGQLIVAKYLLDHGADVNGWGSSRNNTPLYAAAENGHKAMVELLVARGADINGGTLNPLYTAAARGFVGVVEVLLANHADPNLPDANSGRSRPLHAAARIGRTELIQLLLDHGADVNAVDGRGRSPLEYAAMENQTNAARTLLAAKANIELRDGDGNTPLHLAAGAGHPETVSLLLNSGASVDATNGNNNTALLFAITNVSPSCVRVLLEHKADPNHHGVLFNWQPPSRREGFRRWSDHPLIFTLAVGNNEILKLLLEAGANPEGDPASQSVPLWSAINNYNVDAVQLLLQHGADVNRIVSGFSPLNIALRAGVNEKIITALLDIGADPNIADPQNGPPLFYARDTNIGRLLIDHKADVNARWQNGQTPVMNASGVTNYLELLLEAGANPNLQDTNGNTALHFAVDWSQPVSIALLLEHKANPNIQNDQGYTPLDLVQPGRNMGSMMGPNYGPGSLPVEAQKEISELLVKAGGLANLPKRDRIEVRRADNTALAVFKDPSGRNRYSLLEVVADAYEIISRAPGGSHGDLGRLSATRNMQQFLRFPDFKKVVIYRRTENSAKQTTLNVNLEDILNSGDCSRDVWLEWGDIVEIPEADHPVNEGWPGLSSNVKTPLTKCVDRRVTVKIKGESTTLDLPAKPVLLDPGVISLVMPGGPPPSFMLRSVLNNSKLIRVSSDLSRVKVTRTDPVTKKTTEWIVDCNSAAADDSDLWLRDGDVIEVPEK